MERSPQSLADLPLDHPPPVDMVRKMKRKVVVADRTNRTVHVRLFLDFQMRLEKVWMERLEIEFQPHNSGANELLDLDGEIVMFPIGSLMDDAEICQRSIQEMEVLMAMGLLDLNGELSFQDEIGRVGFEIRPNFGDTKRLFDHLQRMDDHPLRIVLDAFPPSQLGVDISDEFIADLSFVEMP